VLTGGPGRGGRRSGGSGEWEVDKVTQRALSVGRTCSKEASGVTPMPPPTSTIRRGIAGPCAGSPRLHRLQMITHTFEISGHDTGARGDNGIDHNMNWLRFPYDSTFWRSHHLPPHPYHGNISRAALRQAWCPSNSRRRRRTLRGSLRRGLRRPPHRDRGQRSQPPAGTAGV
jgi:hypothetical protein